MGQKQPTVVRDASGGVDFSESDLTGTRLSGRYRVEEKLGEGAMGAVFRAEHELMKKTVAIKVLRPNMNEESEIVARFRREAQAAAHIDHPNVCAATDFGQMPDGTFFLVIEYLEGRTLEEELESQGRLPAERALHIADQIADALDQAHAAGVIHRDLKPENVMLVEREGDRDFVKIMDFGVAHVRISEEHETERLTRAGHVYGTPSYMSPEQASGGDADPRSDIYSLGVICYELLTGEVPFEHQNAARVMAMHVTEEPLSPRERAPDAQIPEQVEALVLDLMAKDAARRPQSAEQLRARISAIRERDAAGLSAEFSRRGREAVGRVADEAGGAIGRARDWLGAQEPLTRTAILLAGLALILAVVVVPAALIITSVGGSSPEQRAERERNLNQERARFLEKEATPELQSALESKRPGRIAKAVEAMLESDPDNAHLLYLRGVHRADLADWKQALAAYEQALAADAVYGNDSELLDDVFSRFESGNEELSETAADIIRTRLDESITRRRLAEIARNAGSKTREKAVLLLKRTGGFDDLEDWNRSSILLLDAAGCDEHEKLIEQVVSAGDSRAVETLETVRRRNRRGCGILGLQQCLKCVKDDLDDAIDTLQAAKAEDE